MGEKKTSVAKEGEKKDEKNSWLVFPEYWRDVVGRKEKIYVRIFVIFIFSQNEFIKWDSKNGLKQERNYCKCTNEKIKEMRNTLVKKRIREKKQGRSVIRKKNDDK